MPKYHERRYTIEEDTTAVEERLARAFLERQLASFALSLSDIYEGEPPIPQNIEHRNIDFSVVRLSLGPKGSTSAFGFTPESATVSVSVPQNKDEKSTLRLLDATKPASSRRRSKKLG